MAVLNKLILAASAFSAFTAAFPLVARQVTSVVTLTAITTIDVAVTVWVDENGTPITTGAPGIPGFFAAPPAATTSSTTPVSTVTSTSTTISAVPPVIPASSPSVAPAPVITTTTPVVVAPTTTVVAQQVATTTPAPAPAPVATSASSAAAPSVSVRVNAPASSDSGTCVGADNACTGDITHWDGGLGACGWNVNTETDMQIALPVGFMGSLSNSNPYCGRSLTIKNPNTGATVQATVGDKCMGCTGYSIDLTNALFNAIGGGCDGRCSGFEWWLN